MEIGSVFTDVFRSLLWFLCQAAFKLMDMVYTIIDSMVKLNLGDFDFIWTWWQGLSITLSFFIIVRMVTQYIKAVIDDDEQEKIDPVALIKRLIVIAFIVALLPSTVKGLSAISSTMASNVGVIVGVDPKDTVPSHIIASAGYQGDIDDFDYESIEINEKDEDGNYIQFPSSFDIIFSTVVAIIADLVFVFIGIQIAQRVVGLLLKILISPYALSGVIDPSDNTFSLWSKLCIADFLTNFFQIMLIMLVMTVSIEVDLPALAKIIFFIGALMAVMNAPAGIAQLLGGDVGVGTAFQQMQSLMMLSSGAQLAGSAIQTAAAVATYATGRAMGGKSLLNNVGRSSGNEMSSLIPYAGGGVGSNGSAISNIAPANETSSGMNSGGNTTMMRSVGSSMNSEPRMTKENSIARGMANMNQSNRFGRAINRVSSSMYQRSAARLARPVQYRTPRGGLSHRQSRFVSASHAMHTVMDSSNNESNLNENQ